MEKVTRQTQAGSAAQTAPLKVPSSVPVIEADELEGAVRRSAKARRLHARLEARAEEGRPLATREVDDLVRGAKRSDGKPDGDQAVVVAEHARRNPGVFGGGHGGLLRFLSRISWFSLIRDLRMFVTKVREEDAQVRKREELKLAREEDRLDEETRRADRALQERIVAEPPVVAVDPRLDADNRLRFTLERMKRR